MVQAELKKAKQDVGSIPHSAQGSLNAVLEAVTTELTKAFAEVSSGNHIKELSAVSREGAPPTALELQAELENGQIVDPGEMFSEANRDLIAFLIFIAVSKVCAAQGQEKVLILDDVLQSVDATIRFRATDYVLNALYDWQLLFTAHDRLWAEQLRELLIFHGHEVVAREILRWDFEGGPVIREARLQPDAPLRAALADGDTQQVCSLAGLLLEQVADRMSWTLPIAVQRRQGDKYTLGDLWPPLETKLRKTTVRSTAEQIGKLLHLRNLAGAHHNEWAKMLSRVEATDLAEAVLRLEEATYCPDCARWVERADAAGKRWACRGGHVEIETIPQG